jgi:NAD+-dependent farnesol dehydrogenase
MGGMKVFLTGGTGYLGGALRAALLEAGHQVTVWARRDPEGEKDSREEWIRGDLRDGPPPVDLLMRHRAVVHAAALVKTWAPDPSEFDRINVDAWDKLLSAATRAGVQKIIHTSSFISLGPSSGPEPLQEGDRRPRHDFRTDYERTKYLADQVTDRWIARGAPVVTVYPGVIFGPGSCGDGNLVGKMIWMLARGKFPGIIGSGKQVWNLAYLPDVARGHCLALQRGLAGSSFILGGENIALGDLVGRVARLLGRSSRIPHIPVAVAEWLGGVMEKRARRTGVAPDLTRGVAAVYRQHWSYNSALAEATLGYRRTPFALALDATVQWARELKEWNG